MATVLFVLGLVALVAAVGGLAGPWWALLVLGAVLVVLAVLTESTPAEKPPLDDVGAGIR